MNEAIRRPVTAHDVAKLAGVSQSAVSRTFTKGASVAPQTKEKVLEAAAALGYRPNFVARSLITRRSNLIGVVVPSMANPFYSEVLESLSKAFESSGHRVLLFSTAAHADSDPILEEVLRHRVDALIMVSASLSSHFAEECKQTGLPVVLLNRKVDSDMVSSVTSDNFGGSAKVADYLIETNHSRLAFIAGSEASSTSRDREHSFCARIAENGLPEPLREVGNFCFVEAMKATRRLLALDSPPDGIFCANDLTAIAALNVVVESGLVPGKDISIVGFDNIAMSKWPAISLTTFVQPVQQLVQKAVDIVSAQLEDSTVQAVQEVVGGELIIRRSSRLPETGLVTQEDEQVWRP
ncbi:TPA: LacI family DNA-binding transcriptional regulator [Pseudomonas aeruginosa]|uniref:LacI family transcriptional regulator n=1 Tax=Pseudomonas monteilii TaxID=76759 RepID=A0A399M648_9PSED|nr:LacI family DNA-binding transcriptional regulator [Pseudomonas monteilii]RII76825.1 LacI family transcriptional regulator [Pseudomonas monteilii]HCF7274952.1 LacI family DNA-binding transcriptional regulator [Pseudomonas aeruginosa]